MTTIDNTTTPARAPGTVPALVVRFFGICRESDGLQVCVIATPGDARQARRVAALNGLGIGKGYSAREMNREIYYGCLERAGFRVAHNAQREAGAVATSLHADVRCPHCGAGQGSFYRSGTVTPSDRTPRAPFVTRCYECQEIVTPNEEVRISE